MTSLARQLAEHPRWQLHRGMIVEGVTRAGEEIRGVLTMVYGDVSAIADDEGEHRVATDTIVPDIEHPATKGWLLAMLREATGTETILSHARIGWCPQLNARAWFELTSYDGLCLIAPTEGEALARALLAAWGES